MLKKFLLTIVWCSIPLLIWSQNTENSPYSRFGLGNLSDPFLAHQGIMGGWSAAFQDPHLINYLNPASLASLRATSFEVGLYGRYNNMRDNLRTSNQWGGNLSYFSLAFPIKNPLNDAFDRVDRKFFWGSGLTLVPFTDVSYAITTTDFQQDIGRVTRQFTGEGGTYRLLISNGWRYKRLSWGVNTGIIFGQVVKNRLIFLNDFPNHFTDLYEEKQLARGFTFDGGLQYEYIFDEAKRKDRNLPKKYLTLGAYGNFGNPYSVESTVIAHRANSITEPFIRDTLFVTEGDRIRSTLPMSVTGGLAYGIDQKFRFGIDYSFTRWSEFDNPVPNPDPLGNSWSINAGGEYIPNALAISSYFKRVRYRAGVKFGNDPRIVGQQLRFFEVSSGLGMPFIVSREISQMHIGFTYGRFGGPNAPINEQYIRVNFGFTFLDNTWFVKRRFY
jgi:hypothetical protein